MKFCAMIPLLFLAQTASAQDHSPPPFTESPPPFGPVLIELAPGEVRCDDGPTSLVRFEAPLPVSGYGPRGAEPAPIRLKFQIDAQGRPLGITEEQAPGPREGRLYFQTSDVVPAFAVSRFAPAARTNCTIALAARAFQTNDAPLPLMQRYFVAPHSRQPDESKLFRRLHPAETNCIEAGSPKLRLRAFPAFEKIPIGPGGWAYAMTGFDIDAKGRPVNVRIVGSDGNAALDRASVAAVQESRYAPEARHGCTYPYYRRSEANVGAPPAPDKTRFAPADARCPDGDTKWTTEPDLQFPNGFAERRIEGWAIVGYDIAPWGQTGNVHVLAAEPAAAFGDKAREIVSAARQASSPYGRTGCVDVVRFVMPKSNPDGGAGPGR